MLFWRLTKNIPRARKQNEQLKETTHKSSDRRERWDGLRARRANWIEQLNTSNQHEFSVFHKMFLCSASSWLQITYNLHLHSTERHRFAPLDSCSRIRQNANNNCCLFRLIFRELVWCGSPQRARSIYWCSCSLLMLTHTLSSYEIFYARWHLSVLCVPCSRSDIVRGSFPRGWRML